LIGLVTIVGALLFFGVGYTRSVSLALFVLILFTIRSIALILEIVITFDRSHSSSYQRPFMY
jgi:hypothetical protein